MYNNEINLLKSFKKHLNNKKIKVNKKYICHHKKINVSLNLKIDKIFIKNRDLIIQANESFF